MIALKSEINARSIVASEFMRLTHRNNYNNSPRLFLHQRHHQIITDILLFHGLG